MVSFTKQEKTVISFLAIACLAGSAVLFYRHVSGRPAGGFYAATSPVAAKTDTAHRPLRVRVDGEVLRPGQYETAPGSTALDVVDRAVPTVDADVAAIAGDAVVSDGARITVPARAGERGGASDGKININTAGADELDTLPGIGPRTAEKIIACRSETPFKDPADLKNVSGIGEKKYQAVKDRITTE